MKNITKDRLILALINLTQDKSLDDITISELTKTAKINRGTFYLSYEDFNDFIISLENNILDDLKILLNNNFINCGLGEGLKEVPNPSEYMLSGRPIGASGAVVACSMEGTRPMLLELQALVSETAFGFPRRTAVGIDFNRVNILMAVIEKRCRLPMSRYDAYINLAGGMRISEPALDLALVLAIVSSYRNIPIDEKTVVFGEVGLSGEIRAVTYPDIRVREAAKLGFTKCIMPYISLSKIKIPKDIECVGVKGISDAIDLIFINRCSVTTIY